MKILNGINDGMVMQRGTATNECDILLSLECDCHIVAVDDAVVDEVFRDASRGVSAHSALGSVEVEHPHFHVGDI